MRIYSGLLLLIWASISAATELRWGFATADGMPYVDVQQQQLRGGFTYQLGSLASTQLGAQVRFIETPNKRVEDFLLRGRIHVICNAIPSWVDQPERFHWSPALYSEEDVLLIPSQQPAIERIEDMHGKVLGTLLGYVYSEPLMQAFAEGRVVRRDLRDLSTSFNLLRRGHLDAVIDMRRPLDYQLSQQPDRDLRISSWVIERYDMHCMYSPQLPVSAEQLDQTLQQLRDEGQIDRMLSTY